MNAYESFARENLSYGEAVDFLELLRPGAQCVLTAIIPDGKTETITIDDAFEAKQFICTRDGEKNLYYSVNPIRRRIQSKAAKTDIAAIEFLFADLDPRDNETPDAAKARYRKALEQYRIVPTFIVDSGNGIQALWHLTEPIKLAKPIKQNDPESGKSKLVFDQATQAAIDDVEDRTKSLLAALGGEAGTQNIDRILRIPGTTNLPNAKKLKLGRSICSTKLLQFNDVSYKLDEFPSTSRCTDGDDEREKADDGTKDFEFLEASLPPDLFELIRDGVDIGKRSEQFHRAVKWLKELGWTEDYIIRLFRKYPGGISSKYEDVATEVRRVYDKPESDKSQLVLDPADPIHSARVVVDRSYTRPGDGLRTLQRHRGAFWEWIGSYYRLADDETISARLWTFFEKAFRREKEKGGWRTVPFKPNRARIGDAMSALNAVTQLDKYIDPPAWLTSSDLLADDFFACGNGLLHLPTGKLYPCTPGYFNLSASTVHFDAGAPRPEQWIRFLDQLWGEDLEAKNLLQDWFGYLLSPDTSQQKILLMVGPPRCGKGTIGRIKTALLGKDSVGGPTMANLSEPFGLEPMITKPLAIISDARIGKRTDKSTIVERLLSISGEDTMTVNRKNKTSWTGKLPTRFEILTNELPSLNDGSGALAGRFVILMMTQSFYGKEDPQLTNKLMTELPGILNWSIEGYRRLRERGYFIQPHSSSEAADEVEMLAAPVKAFVRDCCDIGTGRWVGTDELYDEWKRWTEDQDMHDAGSKIWFSRNLRSAVPGLRLSKTLIEKQREPIYQGIDLKPEFSTRGGSYVRS